ncbi:MAG: hypothetical protein WCV81_01880 [Microgenomates group bacterium]|jgi:drug/metabolite transporter (DMT)-like permease
MAYFAIILSLTFWSITQIILKSIVDKLPKSKALIAQYIISFLFIVFYAIFTEQIQMEIGFFLITFAGFLSSIGAYFQWRAYKISLSKTGLFMPFMNIIAAILTAIFLKEKFLYSNIEFVLGVIFSFIASFLLVRKKSNDKSKLDLEWLFSVFGMIIFTGITLFLMKVFSFSISRTQFLIYWYLGAILGSAIFLWAGRHDQNKLFQKGFWKIPLASIGTLGTLAALYWAFQIAPAAIVLPIQAFGTAFIPLILGLAIFKERKILTKYEIIGFLFGAIGVALIIVSGRT